MILDPKQSDGMEGRGSDAGGGGVGETGKGRAGDAIRAPRQARSRRTLARIVVAARELLAEGGVEAVTVQAVVVRARASVGSFYARFSGKDDLLGHLQATVEGDLRGWWSEALEAPVWEELGLEDAVSLSVRLLNDAREVCAGERRALRGTHEGEAAELRQRSLVRGALAERILAHPESIRHPHPARAVELALRAVSGVLDDLALDGASGAAPVQELTRLVLAYLGAAPGEGEGSPTRGVDFFDVWG